MSDTNFSSQPFPVRWAFHLKSDSSIMVVTGGKYQTWNQARLEGAMLLGVDPNRQDLIGEPYIIEVTGK